MFKDYWKTHPFASLRFEKSEEPESWITVRGAHIPIQSGQTKEEAIKQHLGSKEGETPKGSRAIKPEHIEELHEKASSAKEEIDNIAQKIADKYGIKVKTAPLKKAERIIEKAINDYGGNLGRVKDVARNTLITGHQYLEEVVKELKEHGQYVEGSHKDQKPENFHGYSGHVINIKAKNGHVAEIQVNTPEMIYAKEKPEDSKKILGDALFNKLKEKTGMEPGLGHQHYEVIRSPEHSSEERSNASKLSHEYYDEVRKKSKGLKFE